MTRPALVIFDLDGTLVDSREDIVRACNHALVTHGRAPLPSTTIHQFVGDGARMLVARAFELAPDSPAIEAPLAAFHAFYVAHACDTTTFIPGAKDAIALLARASVKLAVCTNKPRATTLGALRGLATLDAFGFVFAGGDGPLKPDPTGILACCTHFGVAREAAWMVGDGPQDIVAAKNANVRTVAIATSLFVTREKLAASDPDVIVDDFQGFDALVAREL